jgi:hypothetical protein
LSCEGQFSWCHPCLLATDLFRPSLLRYSKEIVVLLEGFNEFGIGAEKPGEEFLLERLVGVGWKEGG